MHTKIILRFDDICPNMNWDSFLYIKENLMKLGIRSLLGVIPDNQDDKLLTYEYKDKFFEIINTYKNYGDTIAQHGTFHKYTSNSSGLLNINNRSEFAGHSYKYQYDLIKKGKSILKKQGCWQPVFIAPSHSFDEITINCLSKLGFREISDGYGFFPFQRSGIKFIPQISSKPFNVGFGVATLCIHINSLNKKNTHKILDFVKLNNYRIIPFEEYISIPTPSEFIVKTLEIFTAKSIQSLRKIRNYKS